MSGCCRPGEYDRIFNSRLARKLAGRFRKRGLDRTARRMTGFLTGNGVGDAMVLEIGGGIGEIGIELLRAGAARARNLELSPAYQQQALQLAEEAGFAERVEWQVHDIAADPEPVGEADLIVLHRVVCCYPDFARLLGAAAEHGRRALVFSYPRRNAISRAFVATFNMVMRLTGRSFRTFTHPPDAMQAVLEQHGLHRTYQHRGLIWQVAGHERG